MARIVVNDHERAGAAGPQTWGDLLDTLDQQLASAGEVVTAARFDGVDEPSFRDGRVTGRALADWTVVEVRSQPPRALLASCLSDVESSLAEMRPAVIRLADVFRGTNLAVANDGLAHVAHDLRGLVSLVQMLAGPLGIELHHLRVARRSVQEHLEALGRLIELLVEAQQQADWLTVGDILEYDLEPLLASWEEIFARLHQHTIEADGATAPGQVAQ